MWTNLNPASAPSPRVSHAMAYDLESDRVILFSGWDGPPLVFVAGDTWAYDFITNTWVLMSPSTSPFMKIDHAMAYDAESDRVILFSGQHLGGLEGDTWAYDFNTNTWANMNPSVFPSPRAGHAMAYDAAADRIVLFGGTGEEGFLADTWVYDFNTNIWTNMTPPTSPAARIGHSLAYNADSDRLVLFGGIRAPGAVLSNDTWAYDLNRNTWTNMNPPRSPSPRVRHAMAYDTLSDRILLFGGIVNASGVDNGTWSYSLKENTWLELHPDPSPPARAVHTMTYAAKSGRIIMFGGRVSPGADPAETWSYHSRALPSFVPLFLLAVILAATASSALVVLLFWRRRTKARDFQGKGRIAKPPFGRNL